jgi:hypothetical protein
MQFGSGDSASEQPQSVYQAVVAGHADVLSVLRHAAANACVTLRYTVLFAAAR